MYRSLPLRMKLFCFAAFCLLLALAIVLVSIQTTQAMARDTAEECGRLSSDKIDLTVEAIGSLCVTQQESLRQLLEVDLKTAHKLADERGGFQFAPEMVSWSATNQFTRAGRSVRLPKMMLGKMWLGQNADKDKPSPLVDEVKNATGATCTIFQRVNEEGDMIRVCTNIEDASGRRAIGTYIPATGPDGKKNAVVASLLRGETYRGRAFVVKAWYITAYEPIVDRTGRVIGSLYVGVPQENVPALRTAITNMRVGTTGRTFVVDSQGGWIIKPRDNRGEELQAALSELSRRAVTLTDSAIAEYSHTWQSSDNSGPTKKLIRFMYFAPWDWVIGVVIDEAEVQAISARVSAHGQRQVFLLGGISAVAFFLILAFALLLARAICRPIAQIVRVLEATAAADFSKRVEITSRDEVGRIGATLNTTIDALQAAKDAEQKQTEKDRAVAELERQRIAEQAERDRLQAEKDRAASARDAVQAMELQKKISAILMSVNAMSVGDFTQQIPDLGDDAVGKMAAALNQAITTVRETLEGVREVSEQLADASGQLASASEEIATGAQQQASSLEETASTLEEITATVKQNSDSAQQARQLASGSKDVAEKGGQVVGNAVEAMGEINQSSKKIAEIITAIDEIAFQTNLLALNAAVEAARAGEQGRGFAVVAAEVRNLAQRSATAAKEIKALIQDSVKKVEAGSELVNRSGATLTEIVTSVKRVTDIVTEIAAASREQSTGIDQVNKAVTQMDTVTQRNASQTEEMSATAQTLTDQAGQLRELVSRFKLGQSESVRPVVSRAAAGNGKAKAPAASKPRPAVAQAMKNGHTHELDRLGSAKTDDGFTEF